MNDFDKALDDILLRHGAEQGELHHSLKEAIKQVVSELVIGKNLHWNATQRRQYSTNEIQAVEYEMTVNGILDNQREVLWGTKE